MTQAEQILQHLETGATIDGLIALDQLGCFRLAARIAELRNDGHDIETEMITTPGGARIARYRLVKKPEFQLTP